jgi:hypothetical protein
MWQLVLSGIALGLISSFHCVGMCGAIAFSLPIHYLPAPKKLSGILLYNIGRVTTYSILGLIFGFIGRQVYLGGFQQWFSISIGVLILLILIQSVFRKNFLHLHFFNQANVRLQQFIGKYIQQKQLYGMFLIGAANGLLPCGMVYFAIAGALAAGSIAGGVAFMAMYGLGTMPLMIMLSYFGFMIDLSVRNTMKKIVPYFVATMAVLLILRGMNLGIPYISPYLENTSGKTISCH